MANEFRRAATELRISEDSKQLVGYAAVFDAPAEILEWGFRFTEVVRPGAFARSLASNPDILCTFEHTFAKLLGRTASGTAKFTEDKRGLRFEVTLTENGTGAEVRELVRRGDLRGASFMFSVPSGGDKWTAPTFRELVDVNLIEAGPVVNPAYESTSLGLRSDRGGDGLSWAIIQRQKLLATHAT